MRKTRTIFLCIAALLCVSCVEEQLPEETGQKDEIVVSVNLPEGWTPLESKAEITSESDLQSAGFGLFAYYTGTNDYSDISSAAGVIFNNRQVTYSASNWSYGSYSEYWPTKEGEKVSFFAYAPWSDWNGTVTKTGAAPAIPYTVMDAGAVTTSKLNAQKDLLWGTQSNGSPYRNVTRDGTGGKVNLFFRHAISKIRFFVAGGATSSIKEASSPEYGSWSTWNTYSGGGVMSSTRVRYRTRYHYYKETTTKYFVNSLTVSGLSGTGTLNLNNTDAYSPLWSNVSGSRSYSISPSDVLRSSLQYVNSSSTGITEDLTPVMSNDDYYLYVIPGYTALFSLNYSSKNMVISYRSTITEYQNQTRSYGSWYDSGDPWQEESAGTVQSSTVTDGETKTVSATMSGTILPSRKYDFNLYLQGSSMELTVVPRRWDVNEMTYDYSNEENERIQYLTYDSDYIDYAEGGNVYINNRLGHFYFRLGEGKYKYWQASMISAEGSDVFGFCDSEGNFLYDTDGTTLLSIIRGPIDGSMSHIYMRAIDSSSTTGGKAKLRIYLFDSDDVPTIALDLVNMTGVTEWTIIQNAN